MGGVLRVGDTLTGHNGEHGGHYYPTGAPVHPSNTLSGHVSTGSPNVFIDGKAVARKGDSTAEFDACTNGSGKIVTGSSSVLINGQPIATIDSKLSPHAGSGKFTSCSPTVSIG